MLNNAITVQECDATGDAIENDSWAHINQRIV